MTFSLKQYNKSQYREYTGEPKKGEVWEIIEKSNSIRPYDKKVPIVVISNKGGEIRALVCSNCPSRDVKQYEIKDPRSAGVFDKNYVDLNVISFPRNRLTRRLGRLSGFDKNLVMFY